MNLQDLIAKTTPDDWIARAGWIISEGPTIADCRVSTILPPEQGNANAILICHMHKTYMELVEALQAIELHQQTTIEPTAEGFQAIARIALTNANTIL